MSVVALSVIISEVGTICDTVDKFGEDGEDSSCCAAATTREDSEDDDNAFYYMIMGMPQEIIKIALETLKRTLWPIRKSEMLEDEKFYILNLMHRFTQTPTNSKRVYCRYH